MREGFSWVEAGFVDDGNASDAGGDFAVIGDRETQHGVGDFIVECEVQRLDRKVAAGGSFGDGKALASAHGIFHIGGGPRACCALGLLPSRFIDGETSPCESGAVRDEIGRGVGAGLEVVGETHGIIGDGDSWFGICDLNSMKRSEYDREEE